MASAALTRAIDRSTRPWFSGNSENPKSSSYGQPVISLAFERPIAVNSLGAIAQIRSIASSVKNTSPNRTVVRASVDQKSREATAPPLSRSGGNTSSQPGRSYSACLATILI